MIPSIAPQRTKCISVRRGLLGRSLLVGFGGAVAAVGVLVALLVSGGSEDTPILEHPEDIRTGSGIAAETLLAHGSPVLGDADAPIILVEFGDYQCHFCNVFFHSTEGRILEGYVDTGQVKMIFKDYNIIGPDSVNASHGAHCAGDQGLFWEYHGTLYSNWTGENNGWASLENLDRFAMDVGVDTDRWSECMADRPHSGTILASNDDAKTLELGGTPAFFVIGPDGSVTRIFGAQPYHTFERAFEDALDADL